MGGAVFLPCWLFGLRHRSLHAVWSQVSTRAHASEYSPESLPPVSLFPQWAITTPQPLQETIQSISAGRSSPGSYEVTTFFSGFWCARELICALQAWFLFPSVLRNSSDQTSLAFKVRFSGGSSCSQTPRLGSLTWGSEPSRLWKNFCGYFPLCGASTSRYGIYHDCAHSYHFILATSLSLDLGSFLGGSSVGVRKMSPRRH